MLRRLGDMPVEQFMRRYWQKRPVLIRKALPDFRPPVAPQRLFDLAARDEVESRLVTAFAGQWRLHYGPFSRRALPARTRPLWTLLVQGVDLHDDAAAALLARFRFLPDARIDDLMVSFATDGGGVGPHVDSYDVFLLQAQGRRRWRISRQRDRTLVEGLPLKILADFRATHEWVLGPGDLLYLPPGVAHEGTAIGSDCITCSIGLRAPRWTEAAEAWFQEALKARRLDRQYGDPGLLPTHHPGALPAAMVNSVLDRLRRLHPTRANVTHALLAFLSEPKPSVLFTPPRRALGRTAFAGAAAARGVIPDRRSRMLYARGLFAINGEVARLPKIRGDVLRSLADLRHLTAAACRSLPAEALDRLHDWYVAGWLSVSGGRGKSTGFDDRDE